MRKIIEYGILMSSSTSELANDVNDAIAKGWQPYGSLTINNAIVAQAMVKYQLEEKRSY
jgi:hypothetical protein